MKSPIRNIYELIATFFGVGAIKYAPGTFGTLAAAIIAYFIPNSVWSDTWFLILFIIIFFFLGTWISTEAEKTMGHDNGHIVIDEVCGYWLAVAPFTPVDNHNKLLILGIGFVLFRIFDIFKPFPINLLQKLPSGWGVMLDDIMAGVFTFVILYIISIVWFTERVVMWSNPF